MSLLRKRLYGLFEDGTLDTTFLEYLTRTGVPEALNLQAKLYKLDDDALRREYIAAEDIFREEMPLVDFDAGPTGDMWTTFEYEELQKMKNPEYAGNKKLNAAAARAAAEIETRYTEARYRAHEAALDAEGALDPEGAKGKAGKFSIGDVDEVEMSTFPESLAQRAARLAALPTTVTEGTAPPRVHKTWEDEGTRTKGTISNDAAWNEMIKEGTLPKATGEAIEMLPLKPRQASFKDLMSGAVKNATWEEAMSGTSRMEVVQTPGGLKTVETLVKDVKTPGGITIPKLPAPPKYVPSERSGMQRWEETLREKILQGAEAEHISKKSLAEADPELLAEIETLAQKNLPETSTLQEYWKKYLSLGDEEPFPIDFAPSRHIDPFEEMVDPAEYEGKMSEVPEDPDVAAAREFIESEMPGGVDVVDEVAGTRVMSWESGKDSELASFMRRLPPELGAPPRGSIAVDNMGQVFVGAGFKDWLARTAKGMVQGFVVVGPLLQLLNKAVPGISGFIGTGLTVWGLVASGGDPTGLIITAALEVMHAYQEQARKVKENLKPGADRGTKIGYVREGDRWVPAVFNVKLNDTGLWANHQTVTAQTGDHILFKMNPSAGADRAVQPVVFNDDGTWGHKTFTMTDNEYNNKMITGRLLAAGKEYRYDNSDPTSERIRPGSKASIDNFDMLRNWYFLSPEDLGKVVKGDMKLESYMQDTSGYNPYEKQINDWRKVAGLMATGGTSDKALAKQMTEYDVSKELRNAVSDESKHNQIDNQTAVSMQYGKSAVLMGSNNGNTTAKTWDSSSMGFAGLDADGFTDKLVSDNDFYRWEMPENDWLLNDMFAKQVELLQTTQLNAATEAGFKDRYYYDPYRDYHKEFYKKNEVQSAFMGSGYSAPTQTEAYNPIWASLYLDTTRSMATAGSYDELQAQVDTINAYTDRTEAQRQYLVQKSITRYWMDQIGQRGGGKQLIDKMYAHSIDPGNMKGRLNNAAYDFQRVHDKDPYDEQPWVNQYDNTSYTDMSNIPAWVMPWQNAGEGVLPDDMHLPDLGSWYDDALERLGDESRENTSAWIKDHGAYNPNVLIDGYFVKDSDHDIMDDYHYVGPKEEPDEVFGWDPIARIYVAPGEESPGLVLDPDTGDYVLAHEDLDKPALGKTGPIAEDETEKLMRELGVGTEPKKPDPYLESLGYTGARDAIAKEKHRAEEEAMAAKIKAMADAAYARTHPAEPDFDPTDPDYVFQQEKKKLLAKREKDDRWWEWLMKQDKKYGWQEHHKTPPVEPVVEPVEPEPVVPVVVTHPDPPVVAPDTVPSVAHPDPPKFQPGPSVSLPGGIQPRHLDTSVDIYMPTNLNMSFIHHMEGRPTPAASGIKVI